MWERNIDITWTKTILGRFYIKHKIYWLFISTHMYTSLCTWYSNLPVAYQKWFVELTNFVFSEKHHFNILVHISQATYAILLLFNHVSILLPFYVVYCCLVFHHPLIRYYRPFTGNYFVTVQVTINTML